MNIYKRMFEELKSKELTVKEHEITATKVRNRAKAIWDYICKSAGVDLGYFYFPNYIDEPLLDVQNSENVVSFVGDWLDEEGRLGPYSNGFPTVLLWEPNWKKIIEETLQENKTKVKNSFSKKKKLLKELSGLDIETLEQLVDDYC